MKHQIDRREFLAAIGTGAVAALLSRYGFAPNAEAAEMIGGGQKPNIILILIDDLGYEYVSCNGSLTYKTPNVDKLAAGGMRFEHCHVQPLCTPTRAQLMTGIYNVRNYRDFGSLDRGATTFAHLLKRSGYATGIAGKWQLSPLKKKSHNFKDPKWFGFDEYCLWQLTRRPPRYANPCLEINGKEINYTNGEYGPDIVNDYALDFIKRKKGKPFFLYYPMMLPHAPFEPTPDSPDWDPKAMGEKVNNKKYFADHVAYLDKLVGKVVAALDDHGLREKTLILFLGDNGTEEGVPSQLADKTVIGAKAKTTTFGTHVPLVVNWPKTVPAGKVSSDLIDSTDFLPTLCAAAGAEIPAKLKIDGHSFFPQLRGEKGTPREWMYSWYRRDEGNEEPKEFAATVKYKLYRTGEFFDYERDPEEKNPLDIASLDADAAAARKKLQGVLDQYKNARPARFGRATPNKKKKT